MKKEKRKMEKNKLLVLAFFLLFSSCSSFAQKNIVDYLGNVKLKKKDSLTVDRIIQYELTFYASIAQIDSIQVTLRLFDSKEAFNKHQKEINRTIERHVPAFFSTRTGEAIVLCLKETDYLPYIYHETSHYFLYKIIKKPPMWLNEGLARYFENIYISKKTIKHYLSDYEIGRIKTMIEIDDLKLKEILNWEKKDFMKEQRTDDGYTYTLAHGIVYFLIKNNEAQFKQIAMLIKEGKTSLEALELCYKGGYEQFKDDFITYYSKIH